MHLDTSGWGGEGTFTPVLIDALKAVEAIELLRVEDAPASRAEPGYAFISNEIYVTFTRGGRSETVRRLGISLTRRVEVDLLTIRGLGEALGRLEQIGSPDYADDGMLQYLRTEHIQAPYQPKAFKLIEMVRVYRAGQTTAK